MPSKTQNVGQQYLETREKLDSNASFSVLHLEDNECSSLY